MNQNQTNTNESGGVEYAASALLKMGLTPSQVAYVFRGVMDGIMRGEATPSVKQVDNAFVGKVDALANGFSMAHDDGYCYLKGVKAIKRVDVALDLGVSPTVERFMNLSSDEFDVHALKKLTFIELSGGGLHLRESQPGEVSAYDSLSATLHHKVTGISPSYRAFARGGKHVTPLSLTATVGMAPPKADGECDLAQCLSRVCGVYDKVVVVSNPGGVTALSRSSLAVTVVSPLASIEYVAALFPLANVVTADKLAVSNQHDVVIVISDTTITVDAMKMRIGKSALFAGYCIGFCALDASDVTQGVVTYLRSFPVIDVPDGCSCGLLVRGVPSSPSRERSVEAIGVGFPHQVDNSSFWIEMAGVTVTHRNPADALIACTDLSVYGDQVYTLSAIGRSVSVIDVDDFKQGIQDREWPVMCIHDDDVDIVADIYGSATEVVSATGVQGTTHAVICLVDLGTDDHGIVDIEYKVGVALTRHTLLLKYFCPHERPRSVLSGVIRKMLDYHDEVLETAMLPTPPWLKDVIDDSAIKIRV